MLRFCNRSTVLINFTKNVYKVKLMARESDQIEQFTQLQQVGKNVLL